MVPADYQRLIEEIRELQELYKTENVRLSDDQLLHFFPKLGLDGVRAFMEGRYLTECDYIRDRLRYIRSLPHDQWGFNDPFVRQIQYPVIQKKVSESL